MNSDVGRQTSDLRTSLIDPRFTFAELGKPAQSHEDPGPTSDV